MSDVLRGRRWLGPVVVYILLIAAMVQLVPGPRTQASSSEAISGTVANALSKVIGVGNNLWCAVNSLGAVQCQSPTGLNNFGQLGQGNTTNPTTTNVVTVSGLTSGVEQIAVGNNHACAVMAADGSVKCWGGVSDGSTVVAQPSPQPVLKQGGSSLTGVTDISTFATSVAHNVTCAVAGGGSVWCWGVRNGGMGISGDSTAHFPQAVQILASGATAVSTGFDASCAIMTNGTVQCWGTGNEGQIGAAGAASFNNPPTQVTGLTGVVALSAGNQANCALLSTGAVRCWGDNSDSVVDPPSGSDAATPAAAIAFPLVGGERVVALSLSQWAGLALTDQGRTYRWGRSLSAPQTWVAGTDTLGLMASNYDWNMSCRVYGDFVLSCAGTDVAGFAVQLPAPGPPSIGGLLAGDGRATVTVSAGSGALPDSYLVTAQPGGATCTVTAPATSCDLSPLTNGVSYSFSATATNAGGTSAAGASQSIVVGPPALPTIPSVVAGIASATVSVAPGAGGGTPSGYVVYAEPGGHSCTVTPPATDCTLTGLTDGTLYTVTTAAVNGAGVSAPSDPAEVLPGPPAVPDAPTVVVGDASATVSVVPGAGGGTVAGYVVTAQPGAHSCVVTPPATSCALAGLTNGVDYTFTTTATNGAGTSVAGAGVTTLVDVLPDTPPPPSIVVGATQATVSVTRAPTGGVPQSYVVVAEPGGLSCTVVPPATSCAISGLTEGVTYDFTSTAVNGIGASATSSATSAVFAAPAPPVVGGSIVLSGQATVSVTPGSGGGPVSQYVLVAQPGGHSCNVSPPDTSCVIAGLTDGVTYSVTAAAFNGLGSATTTTSTPVGLVAPDAPPAPVVLVGPSQATVSVSPATTGGPPSTYTVTAQPGGLTCVVTAPATSCVINGLTDGVTYDFTTTATNPFGTSPASAATEATVAPPEPPAAFQVVAGNQQATAAITPGNGGGNGSVFVLYAQPGDHRCTVTPPATSCVFTGLTNGITYTVTAAAINGFGTATTSATASVTPRAPLVLQPLIPTPSTSSPSTPSPSTPTTTSPPASPTTTPPAPQPVPVPLPGSSTGGNDSTALPDLAPGAVVVVDNGEPVAVDVDIETASDGNTSELVLRHPDFELRLAAECSQGCGPRAVDGDLATIELRGEGTVIVTGYGFKPGTIVHVWLFSTPSLLGTVTVNPDGTFQAAMPVGVLEAGEHTLQVNGTSNDDRPRSANLGVLVNTDTAPNPNGTRLPATGQNTTGITWGLLLLAAGVLTLTSRRWVRNPAAKTGGFPD